MMKPEPSPQPVLMKTVASRASSMALRAGGPPVAGATLPGLEVMGAGDGVAGLDCVLSCDVRVTFVCRGARPRITRKTIAPVISAVRRTEPNPTPEPSLWALAGARDRTGVVQRGEWTLTK